MKALKFLALALGVGLFLLATTVRADDWDKMTKITFSGPVQVGKTTLPAGTYVFKLLDSSDRHVVMIYNEDESHLVTMLLANPDYRMEPTSKTVVKFKESRHGASEYAGEIPEAGLPMKEWFYPGDNWGQEFRTPRANYVAEGGGTATVTTEAAAAPAPQPETPEAAAPAPEPAPAPQEEAAPAPAAAAPQEATPAPTEQPAQPATQPEAAPSELPQTASQLPLVGLIGLLSLAVAASLRIFLKISA